MSVSIRINSHRLYETRHMVRIAAKKLLISKKTRKDKIMFVERHLSRTHAGILFSGVT